MYLLYVDESGDPGINGSEHLLLAGAAVFEGKWQYIDRDLHRLICQYFPIEPRPTEIHAADLYKGKKEYRRLSPQDRAQLIQDLGNLVRNLLPTEVALFTVIADKRWWFRRNPGKSGDDLYAELFENLSGRFDLFLRRRFAETAQARGS
ncbi:MAG: DUF3800 domain-containing protein [Pirellulales bacterium]|nr:DUF3800 domain-containing protein [Pirellulales bacterium]